jgi:adenine specific DNA methylase Mod
VFELFAHIARYIFIGLIYYFMYNFLKVMIVDLMKGKEEHRDSGYLLLDDDGIEYTLYKMNTIGRAQDSDIVLNDPYLSSKHALIYKKGSRMLIQDLHSKNGTFVNGKKIKKPMVLKDEDEVVIGSSKLLFLRRETGGLQDAGDI